MKNRSYVLVVALVVAVFCSSASALVVNTAESFSSRNSIANMIDGLGGDSSIDLVLEIGTGGSILASGRVDHDGPFSLILDGGDFTCSSDGDGYKLPDNATGNPAFIGIYNGTMDLQRLESFGLERDCTIEIGANGILNVALYYSEVTVDDDNNNNIGNMVLEGSVYASAGLELDVLDLGDGAVQITAVPEPVTLALLGLGGLLLRRRK